MGPSPFTALPTPRLITARLVWCAKVQGHVANVLIARTQMQLRFITTKEMFGLEFRILQHILSTPGPRHAHF